MGYQPGMACHCMTGSGYTSGSQDFTDVLSMYLRLIVEGLFGIRFNLLEQKIDIAPNFPSDWESAKLKVRDISVQYHRRNRKETLTVKSGIPAKGIIRFPLRAANVETVALNGKSVNYHIEPAVGRSCIVVEIVLRDNIEISVIYGKELIPTITFPTEIFAGEEIRIDVNSGILLEYKDPSGSLSMVKHDNQGIHGRLSGKPGWHTVFMHIRKEEWDGWLPADFHIKEKPIFQKDNRLGGKFYPLDISKYFNISLTEIHKQQYLNPRPKGYSIMTRGNGRYCWDWNTGGWQKTVLSYLSCIYSI